MTGNDHKRSTIRDDLEVNPNALHDYHSAKRGPKGVPNTIMARNTGDSEPKDPGHSHATAKHVWFKYFDQRTSNAPFGYEHFVSLPPSYAITPNRRWPLILFLHGAGESQRNEHESYLSIRHGIPKIILCYDKWREDPTNNEPSISIPRPERFTRNKQAKDEDNSEKPVPVEVGKLLGENFVTVTPSLNMAHGYGWNTSILSALLDEIVDRYRVDLDRIHVTGFSMGGYGTWALAMHSPNRFASLVPICGGGDHLRASHIKHIPQWVCHGDIDPIIPVRASEQMVDALNRAGTLDVRFTVYPDVLHDSWTMAYNDPALYKWILSHRRTVDGEEKVVPEDNKITVAS